MAIGRPAKKIIRDKKKRPVAVQISYRDWIKIERKLGSRRARMKKKGATAKDLEAFRGALKLDVDPLDYQARMRAEWP
ncbi:MAG: hypothetical protein ACT4N4_15415 [Rhodospirillales bacterium]